jgi:hypothetical protein
MKKLMLLAALALLALPVSAQINLVPAASGDRVMLCSGHALTATTTGTVEQILATCTIPASSLPSAYYGFEVHAHFSGAANTRNKNCIIRIGGIAGTIATQTGTVTTSGDQVHSSIRCVYTAANTITCGPGTTNVKTGTVAGQTYTLDQLAFTFTNAVDIVMTGTTSGAAGDVTVHLLKP